MESRLVNIEKRLTRIETLVWIVFGGLAIKAGFDVTPVITAMLGG